MRWFWLKTARFDSATPLIISLVLLFIISHSSTPLIFRNIYLLNIINLQSFKNYQEFQETNFKPKKQRYLTNLREVFYPWKEHFFKISLPDLQTFQQKVTAQKWRYILVAPIKYDSRVLCCILKENCLFAFTII